MPDVFLGSGAMITLSTEDYDLATERAWRVWVHKADEKPAVVADVMAKRKRYRLHLHREIAFRMRPDLIPFPQRMRVTPKNGNFLDVRRENLEIAVKPPKRGGQRRPRGHATGVFHDSRADRGQPAKSAPAWSREANLRCDGPGCGKPDQDARGHLEERGRVLQDLPEGALGGDGRGGALVVEAAKAAA